MSRNTDRMGQELNENKKIISDPEIDPKINSNLSFPSPIEAVDLPTKGKFYSLDHPLHNIEFVEIRHMTAADEEILTSKTLLQKGIALERMIQGLLIDKRIKVDEMFVGDKNAVVMSARMIGYDPIYKTNVVCPACGTRAPHEFDLREVKPKEVAEDILISGDGTFEITLPNTDIKLELKMLTGNDERSLQMRAENKKKHNLPESPLRDQLKAIIVSIDGDKNRETIEKYVDKEMLAKHSKFVREEYARIIPNLDLRQDFECEACGTFSSVAIPFRAEFFWPQ